METRISRSRAEEVSSSLGLNNVCRFDASGFSGNIWVLWNSQDTDLDILSVADQTIDAFAQLLFKDTIITHLPKTSFDHHPILLNTDWPLTNPHNLPFRLETMWFNDPSFNNVVLDAWQAYPDDIIQTFKLFTNRVKIWNKETFGNIFLQKKQNACSSQRHSNSPLFKPLSLSP
nr:hypothetical protein CFP56_46127 [Quercus suber]